MNQSDFEALLAEAGRRDLEPGERAALQAWLAQHPADHETWRESMALRKALSDLPEAPLSAGFTRRVLAAVERLDQEPATTARGAWSWLAAAVRGWRAAAAGFAVLLAAIGISLYGQARERARLADSAVAMSALAEVPDLEALAEFELVYHLPSGPLPDEQELAKAFE